MGETGAPKYHRRISAAILAGISVAIAAFVLIGSWAYWAVMMLTYAVMVAGVVRAIAAERREGMDTSAWYRRYDFRQSVLMVGVLLGGGLILVVVTIVVAVRE
jgi:uncharacterized membrane protein YphA (DoxX/SURF4 family)